MDKFEGTHESELFWDRLLMVYNKSSHTHSSLAEQVGVSRNSIQRLLARERNTGFVKMLIDVSKALGVSLKTLLDYEEELPFSTSVGCKSLDAMVMDCYKEDSPNGIEGFSNYAHDNYRVYNDHYNGRVSVRYSETLSSDGGLSLETERMINAQNAAVNGTWMRRTLQKHYLFEGILTVIYTQTTYVKHQPDVTTSRDYADQLVLEHKISDYMSDSKLKPRIVKRHWAGLKSRPDLMSNQ